MNRICQGVRCPFCEAGIPRKQMVQVPQKDERGNVTGYMLVDSQVFEKAGVDTKQIKRVEL